MKYCKDCGSQIDTRAEICPSCGIRQESVKGEKNKIVAALLAFFIGGLGIHKFYLNQPVLGAVYLIFCWTLIPILIAFIEGIIYLFKSDEDFKAQYG
jgi:TM2 domain-containing membrane protein YozV